MTRPRAQQGGAHRARCPRRRRQGDPRPGSSRTRGKFWLRVMNELNTRGVEDVLLAVVDGLKGLPRGDHRRVPGATVQPPDRVGGRLCIVHLLRHSLNFVSWKDRKAVRRGAEGHLPGRRRRRRRGRARRLRGRGSGAAATRPRIPAIRAVGTASWIKSPLRRRSGEHEQAGSLSKRQMDAQSTGMTVSADQR